MSGPDVALIITGHAEGSLAHSALRAVRRCLLVARDAGLVVEVVGVLDNADEETRRVFVEYLGPTGLLQELCEARTLEVSVADCGMARMAGIHLTRAPYVGVLDADNLPTSNWLVTAVMTARDHGAPCVVHADRLFIFDGRVELWPQLASDDPLTRPENFYDRNYWDTFCLAHREVFEQHPYVEALLGSGFGPEDWHWNTLTLHAGVAHLPAPGTTLFYRAKREGSRSVEHARSGSLIHRTPLLTDAARAAAVVEEARAEPAQLPRKRPAFLRRLVDGRSQEDTVVPPPLGTARSWSARLARSFLWPAHYRFLYSDVAHLSDTALAEHFGRIGRREGRRGWLRADELEALAPERFDVAHYRALHADVVQLGDVEAVTHYLETGLATGRRAKLTGEEVQALQVLDLGDYQAAHVDLAAHSPRDLVQHYLEHGLTEGRRSHLTDDERQRFEPVVLDELLRSELNALRLLEPRIPLPDSPDAADMRVVGPAPGGALTAGARVWWQVVAALAGGVPDIVFFVPGVRPGDETPMARCATAMARRHPDLRVLVVSTHGGGGRPEVLGDGVGWLDLASLAGFDDLTPHERRYLVAMLVIQYAPRLVHACDSPEFSDALEVYPNALAASTRIVVSTSDVDSTADGEVSDQPARRQA